MGLNGKLIAAIEFKAGGDVFHELLRHNPHDISTIAPEKVQGCDLHEGQYGHVGSIIAWRYTHDGKDKWGKQEIQAIDEEKKLIQLKTLEGDAMEIYKSFIVTIHVENNDDGVDLVTWTIEYEMPNEDVKHPTSLLSYFIHLTKDIEDHHLPKPWFPTVQYCYCCCYGRCCCVRERKGQLRCCGASK